jgi:leucyl aminopeptidase
LRSYSFLKYKKNKTIFNPKSLNVFSINNFKLKNLNKLLNLLKSINFCKDLVSEPANILNPVTYAEKCLPLKKFGLKVKILSLKQLEKISMGSLLSVSRGSAIEPRVIIFEWKVRKSSKPTILVGKGVTFDTGGISIKPARGMEEMIMDMAGSAVVVGSMMNIALNKINKPIVGIIGLVENMPDAKAQRPGDIVRSLSGQTIEVLNTDAEGRLVLADLLTYVQKKYSPKEIIDFATLTGAIMIALGTHKAGLFSNNDKLSRRLENSGKITGENVWRMPLGRTYDKEIDSQRADMKNIGTTIFGGSIQAAQFLKRFIKDDIPWAHLDIAGVTWSVKNTQNGFSELHAQGATAFGVRLIDQFLKSK